jgi:hypothetical protein
MTRAAQRGYYNLASAGSTVSQRIEALAQTIPVGSTILDIGCNDGLISSSLIDMGVVKKSYCNDLENIITHLRPQMEFFGGDIMSMPVEQLPEANGVLILNVLHHLIGRSLDQARAFLEKLLSRYEFICIDFGSFSEKGDWGWRKAYDTHWASDAEMWDDLFRNVAWRFKLLRYPTQGKGHRVLWKLYREKYALTSFETVAKFVKTSGSWPSDKNLIEFEDMNSLPEPPPGGVIFEKYLSPKGDLFWGKRFLPPAHPSVVRLEYEIFTAAKASLDKRKSKGDKKFAHFGLYELVPFPREDTVCAIYEPDMVDAAVVHFQDWVKFFDNKDVYLLSAFAARAIKFDKLGRLQILNMADFQAASGWDGIRLLDFEPNLWVREILGK